MRIEKVFILLPSTLELRRGVCTTGRRFWGCYLAALDVGRSHTHIYQSALLVAHGIGKIFGKLSVVFVRQRSSPPFFSYSYLVHTVFTA